MALALPPEVGLHLAGVAPGLAGARRVPAENMHLSLRFIGEVDSRLAGDIDIALSRVRAPGFSLAISGLGLFHKGRQPTMLWAGIDPNPSLLLLHDRIESALRRIGLEPESRRFVPHVTLARLREIPRRRLADSMAHHGLLRLPPFPVEAFSLFSSVLSRNGSRYREEACYPLDPEPGRAGTNGIAG